MTYLTRMTALEAKATAGPWDETGQYAEECGGSSARGPWHPSTKDYASWDAAEADQRLIAALRNSWPKLRRLIEAMEKIDDTLSGGGKPLDSREHSPDELAAILRMRCNVAGGMARSALDWLNDAALADLEGG